MTNNQKYFGNSKTLSVDKFFNRVLFDKKNGYYSKKFPFGTDGDFLTSPGVSNLFSEIIGIWLISCWNTLGKPKKFNIVELGPGDGSLMKILIKLFQRFPEFNKSVKIHLYEKSAALINYQKKKIGISNVRWIKNFTSIKKGPAIFFGNEFFDAIPIKQFSRTRNTLLEKNYSLNKDGKIIEKYIKKSSKIAAELDKFKCIKKLKFIEFPKSGLKELEKIIKKISSLSGGILLIDYGYLQPNNKNTLQSVIRHKKNKLFDNLGEADITTLTNFKLLNEFFIKNDLKVKKIVTQKFFLEKMGILQRANNLSKKMNFKEQANLYLRLKRLLDEKLMGELFKVIFAYKFKKDNFIGFK